jgi:Enoyl-CoA hydratase/isomerase
VISELTTTWQVTVTPMMPRSEVLERRVLADAVVVGVTDTLPDPVDDVLDEFDLLVTTRPDPPRPWVSASLADLEATVEASTDAAVTLVQVLRATEVVPVPVGLAVESMAYSMLQHGEVFRRWLGGRPNRPPRREEGEPLRLERTGGRLDVVLDRPEVHNALNAAMRDALCDAFDLVEADPSIADVRLSGAGPSFCSGGDLDEFGLATDAGVAHRIRVARSVGRRVHEQADRVTAELHGSCVGAGIEISAFAHRVVAAPDATVVLPEVGMGLIPGAGGTVSLPRRIGRHRTAYLALSGQPIDASTACAWGLVDELAA